MAEPVGSSIQPALKKDRKRSSGGSPMIAGSSVLALFARACDRLAQSEGQTEPANCFHFYPPKSSQERQEKSFCSLRKTTRSSKVLSEQFWMLERERALVFEACCVLNYSDLPRKLSLVQNTHSQSTLVCANEFYISS